MRRPLYSDQSYVYRIYDPVEEKFCSSGRGLYAKNGRSHWETRSGASNALKYMPNKKRLKILTFTLVLLDEDIKEE